MSPPRVDAHEASSSAAATHASNRPRPNERERDERSNGSQTPDLAVERPPKEPAEFNVIANRSSPPTSYRDIPPCLSRIGQPRSRNAGLWPQAPADVRVSGAD